MLASFLLGGFECANHLRPDGRRVDVIASTRHDALAGLDYALLRAHGIDTAHDGLRWQRIETRPGVYDWSSWLPQLHAARETGIEVIWDLLHWGYPVDLDVWSAAFVDRFAAFVTAAARIHREETDRAPWWVAINEISFWSWLGGDMGGFPPFARQRGGNLKAQLVRASAAATRAARAVDPRARFATSEPLIRIHPRTDDPADVVDASNQDDTQWHAVDWLLGRDHDELGGTHDLVDLIGCNYYVNNQWALWGPTTLPGIGHYVPLSDLLAAAYARYDKPVFVSETGCEGSFRAAWFNYVCDEIAVARAAGVPVEGACLYPVLDHPGWDDDRPCRNGLFDGLGDRTPYAPLAREVERQAVRFAARSPGSHLSARPRLRGRPR